MCLDKKKALRIILGISIIGTLFSGYLSYNELAAQTCSAFGGTCGQQISGLPVCVYGLIMYIAVMIVSIIGLKSKK
jgi:uncharacterized membrane protein